MTAKGTGDIIPFFSIEALKAGDQAAFEHLFHQYYQPLCYFSRRLTDNHAVAEEIAQDSFLKLWQRHRDFESLPAIKSFLYTTARNAALNHLKMEARRLKREQDFDANIHIPDNAVIHSIIQTEVLDEIRKAIAQLPAHYGKVLHLAFHEGLKSREIAERLKLPQSTIDNQKARGLTLLKKVLSGRALLAAIYLLDRF